MSEKREAIVHELSVLIYQDLFHFWEDFLLAFSRQGVPSYESFLRSCTNQEALSLLFGLTTKQLEVVLGPVGIDRLQTVGKFRDLLLAA